MPLLRSGGANIWFEQEELLGKSTKVLHRLIDGDAPERAKTPGAALPNQHGRTVLNLADSELLTRFTDGKSLAFDKVGLCKALRSPGSAGPAATTLDGKLSSSESLESGESDSDASGSSSDDGSSSDSE